MTTLIIGGTGRTGAALSKLLHDAGHSVLIASRAGKAPEPFKAVKFDWFDAETHESPFKLDANLDRVFILSPPGRIDGIPHVNKFIDLAISKGVKRFFLLSVSTMGPKDAILDVTQAPQNFGSNFLASIRDHNQISSATQDAKIPFVSTEDIAQAAFDALTAEKSANKDIFVLGPELLSYDDAAKLLTSVLGREIIHKRYTVEEMANLYTQFGIAANFAKGLAGMEGDAANCKEEALFYVAEDRKFIGKHTLLEYSQANKNLWIK